MQHERRVFGSLVEELLSAWDIWTASREVDYATGVV